MSLYERVVLHEGIADVHDRASAIAYVKKNALLKQRRSKLPPNLKKIQAAAHALMWDGDESTGVRGFDALQRAVNKVFPSGAQKKAKSPDSCPKCAGSGKIKAFSHVLGGDCFACKGKGKLKGKKK